MRNWITRPFKKAIILMACFAAGACAADMTLTGANLGTVMGGVYTSPYQITVDHTPMLLICDDFTTNIGVGLEWTATVTSLADLVAGKNPLGTPKFVPDNPATPEEIRNYATAAVLAQELMSLGDFTTPAAAEISYAIWGIFDPTLLGTTTNPSSGEGHLDPTTELPAAQKYLSDAQAVADAAIAKDDFSTLPSLTIYTPNNGPDKPYGLTSSQEFLSVSMAEPSYPAVLAVDLLAVLGLMVAFRRRITGLFN
jgi:hypothetical protein